MVGEGGRGGEGRYAGVDEEAFETPDAGLDEWDEVGVVSGDDAAVEADVDPALAGGGFDLES